MYLFFCSDVFDLSISPRYLALCHSAYLWAEQNLSLLSMLCCADDYYYLFALLNSLLLQVTFALASSDFGF